LTGVVTFTIFDPVRSLAENTNFPEVISTARRQSSRVKTVLHRTDHFLAVWNAQHDCIGILGMGACAWD